MIIVIDAIIKCVLQIVPRQVVVRWVNQICFASGIP